MIREEINSILDENVTAAEAAEAATTLVLPPAILTRVRALVQQQDAVKANLQGVITVALEAMGMPDGVQVQSIDLVNGKVTLAPSLPPLL